MTVAGGCTGCTLDQVMMNTGTTDLHPGDVVALGALAGRHNHQRHDGCRRGCVRVRLQHRRGWCRGGNGAHPGDPNAQEGTVKRTGGRDETATSIKPGEYMTVVTEGTVNLVKVDAGAGAFMQATSSPPQARPGPP